MEDILIRKLVTGDADEILNIYSSITQKPVKSDFRVNFDGFCPAVLSRLRDSVQRKFVCPVQQPAVGSVFICSSSVTLTKTPDAHEAAEVTLNAVSRVPGRSCVVPLVVRVVPIVSEVADLATLATGHKP